MGINRGKQFEVAIKKAASKYHFISIDRFMDPMAGYSGIRNICDFLIYRYPYQYYIECKAVSVAHLNFNHDITEHQWNGLLEKSKIPGVFAGIAVWFISHDVTIFVPIQILAEMREAGSKSIGVRHIGQKTTFEIPGIKKRILYDYDLIPMMDQVEKWGNSMFGGSEDGRY